MDPSKQAAIQQKIKEIEQEKAVTEKRLERFRKAAGVLSENNRKLMKSLGISSHEELKDVFQSLTFHPEGVAMFEQFLEEHGQKPPDFMKDLPLAKKKEAADIPSEKKPVKKRVRFKL
ncbi:hypothetical protein [Desulfospira joergensenii]|uniref:hypothetical protein n=1 Tax=Desulfospira joergensenii TaxID=53329 RepID=UPI0003B7882F|nr:hypothetical protein [Desulfospira joergensenii]